MNIRPECLPCCLRRVLVTADRTTTDEWLHRKILAEAMEELSRVDDKATPAEVIHGLSRLTAKTLGVLDPYLEEKRRWIAETTGNADWIRAAVLSSTDPFLETLRLTLAANLLDCELRQDVVRGFSLRSLVEGFRDVPFTQDAVEDLRLAIRGAHRILFIHATASELFFDRLFLESLGKPRRSLVSVVRESGILAHATREDAAAVGLGTVAEIVDPGIDGLGIPLSACSKEFRAAYRDADLILAKGQACLETLEGKDGHIDGLEKPIFFLLRVKCPVVARHLGVEVGDSVLEPGV